MTSGGQRINVRILTERQSFENKRNLSSPQSTWHNVIIIHELSGKSNMKFFDLTRYSHL
jgi:hypothetical protein